MKEEKVFIIGDPSVQLSAKIAQLIEDGKAELITGEQAQQQGFTSNGYNYPAPRMLEFEEIFIPPLTRAQRRKQARKK